MIGDLRQRVVIQQSVRAADGGGGFTQSWQNIAETPEVFASVMPLSGAEQLKFHQLSSTATHRILMRYRTDVIAGMRLVKDETVYDITSVADQKGLGVFLEILATVKS